MSSSHIHRGAERCQPVAHGPAPAGGVCRFAHGGNGSAGNVHSGPLPGDLPVDRNRKTAASLVMLQLASFEGRAL